MADIKNPNRKETKEEVLKLIKILQREAYNIYDIEYLTDIIDLEPAEDAQGDKLADSKPGNWQISFIIKCDPNETLP